MTKHEIMEYVKAHKKEIALGAACVVGTGVLIALGVKASRSMNISGNPVQMVGDIVSSEDNWMERNLVDGFTTGKVNELWNESASGNAIVQFFKIKDMGPLGEDLKKIKGITDDTEVSAVLGFVGTHVEI